jgi:hypothetical protein
MNDDDTYYDTLGVSPDASRDELRAAYRSRVEELEAARGAKNFSDSALQANREETARVRAAWNVLSDPFQRQRYDEKVTGDADAPELVDDDGDAGGERVPDQGVQLTGGRKLHAPPPPKQPRNGNANGSAGDKTPARRPAPQPTIETPRGTTLADNRSRAMALLFDVSVLLVLFIGMRSLLPNVIQSDYNSTSDKVTACNNVHDASKNPKTSDVKKCGISTDLTAKQQKSAAQKKADQLNNHIKTTSYLTLVLILVAWLLYLVPTTAITGRTLGMRGRKLRVLKVDGSPVGWMASFVRFVPPLLLALVIPTIGPVVGLGLVLWGYRDPNKQGIHDKLAKTIVVQDTA